MEGKMLGWVLLVGLGLLAPRGQASSHGSGDLELPDGCSEAVVRQCFTPFMPSGVLAPFTSDNSTVVTMAMMAAKGDPDAWTQVCGAMKSAVECLEPEERQCFNGSQMLNFTTMLHLNFTVPRVSLLQEQWQGLCTNEIFCDSKAGNCTTTYKDILEHLSSESPNLMDSNNCRQVRELDDCGRDIPSECRAQQHVHELMKGMKTASGYCGELKCAALNQCKLTFNYGGPASSGLNDKTCFLYRNYTRCAGNVMASSSCTDLPELEGDPDLTNVSQLVGEACTAMGQEGINAIYSCEAFTTCINETFKEDSTFLPYVCPIAQGVIGCALSTADSCAGVNATMIPGFESQMTALALKAQAHGCGRARVLADKCAALGTCMAPFSTNPSSDTMVVCSQVQTFQSCAGNAVEGCSLKGPASDKVPELKALSNITQSWCSAVREQPILQCKEFEACTEKVVLPMAVAWQRMNGQAWCQFSVGMVECVRSFSRTCSVSETLMKDMESIYQDLLGEGCTNTFGYVAPPAPMTTPGPTGGAQSLAGVSLMTLLLLTCLSLL